MSTGKQKNRARTIKISTTTDGDTSSIIVRNELYDAQHNALLSHIGSMCNHITQCLHLNDGSAYSNAMSPALQATAWGCHKGLNQLVSKLATSWNLSSAPQVHRSASWLDKFYMNFRGSSINKLHKLTGLTSSVVSDHLAQWHRSSYHSEWWVTSGWFWYMLWNSQSKNRSLTNL